MLAPLAVPPAFTDLDHNATSPMAPAALRAHVLGQRLVALGAACQPALYARLMARCRARLARALGAQPDEVWLTSGGTEANALVVAAAVLAVRREGRTARVVVSELEHPSLLGNLQRAAALGHMTAAYLATSPQGLSLAPPPHAARSVDMVSVMVANNETGVVQPVAAIMKACAGRDSWRHSDGVQALGRLPIHFGHLGIDLLTLAGHKVGAGNGVGALIVRRGLDFEPPAQFGAQRDALGAWGLPGGSALPGAMALAAAVESAQRTVAERALRVAQVRDDFEAQLAARCGPIAVLGQGVPRLPNTSCVRFVGCRAEALLVALDVQGIGISLGSACSAGVSTPSQSVRAMGLSMDAAREVLRVSWPMAESLAALRSSATHLLDALEPLCRMLRQ